MEWLQGAGLVSVSEVLERSLDGRGLAIRARSLSPPSVRTTRQRGLDFDASAAGR